ncbi:MAG: hypothetical protein WCQ96_04435 [Patescibacteria group bacterium]
MEEDTNKRGISAGIPAGVALLVAIVFGAGAYLYVNSQAAQEKEALNAQIVTLQNEVLNAKKAAETTPDSSANATETTDSIAAWATYTDTAYGFSFKHPKGLVITSNEVKDIIDSIDINKSEDINADGSRMADVSEASITVRNSSSFPGDTGSQVTIDSPSGKLTANYMADEAPMGYTYYVYEFQKDGKFYMFRMNNYDSNDRTILMTADQFKQLIGTVTFN